MRTAALMVALLVAGCAVTPVTEPLEPARRYEPDWYGEVAAGTVYRIDPAASGLLVEVRRGGWLSFLGHHHILENRALDGYVWVGPERSAGRADVRVEAAEFLVDPPARRTEGDRFGPQPDPDAVAATRANLLGPRVLDVERFPELTGQARFLGWTGSGTARCALALAVKGHVWEGETEATIVEAPDRLKITVELNLDHADLGLQRISVFGGAISVADRLTVRLTLVAKNRS